MATTTLAGFPTYGDGDGDDAADRERARLANQRGGVRVGRRDHFDVYRFRSVADALDTGLALVGRSPGVTWIDVVDIPGEALASDDRCWIGAADSMIDRARSLGPQAIVTSDVARQLADPTHDFIAPSTDGDGRTTWLLDWHDAVQTMTISVVVAEDSPLVRAGIVALLREEGFDVLAEVGTRDDLLDAARRLQPALVITDVRMPPGQSDEGLVAARTLREEQPGTAVLVLSQHVEPSAAALLLAHRPTAVGYLLKERVSDLDAFVHACRTVASGGVVIDELVTDQLMRRDRGRSIERLSEREHSVLALMAQGRSNAAIARELFLAPKTLEANVRSIFQKLDLPDDPDENRRVSAVIAFLHTP